jgi:hypothetical protein
MNIFWGAVIRNWLNAPLPNSPAARASTASGTGASAKHRASSITCFTTGSVFSLLRGARTCSSCLRSICAQLLLRQRLVHARHGAADDDSAAVPCRRALMAARSLKERFG